jgi:hypothetical protein
VVWKILTDVSEELTAAIIRTTKEPRTEKVVIDIGARWARQSPGRTNGRGRNRSDGRQSRRTSGEKGDLSTNQVSGYRVITHY